jgi:regulatory protein
MEAMSRSPRKVTAKSLENAALHYLQRFATSAENLRRVLMRRVERSVRAHDTDRDDTDREVGAALVDALVERFVAAGLVDDRVYAEGRALSLHRRGTAARVIRGRLRQKGVGDDDIEAALATVAEEHPDGDLAAAVNLARRRRLGPYRSTGPEPDRRQRELAALARAGFSYDIARRVLDGDGIDEIGSNGR